LYTIVPLKVTNLMSEEHYFEFDPMSKWPDAL